MFSYLNKVLSDGASGFKVSRTMLNVYLNAVSGYKYYTVTAVKPFFYLIGAGLGVSMSLAEDLTAFFLVEKLGMDSNDADKDAIDKSAFASTIKIATLRQHAKPFSFRKKYSLIDQMSSWHKEEWPDQTPRNFFNNLIKLGSQDNMYLITYKGNIIGTFALLPIHINKQLMFGDFYIDKYFRGYGIGGHVIEEVKKIAQEKGYDLAFQTFNRRLPRFYLKHGANLVTASETMDSWVIPSTKPEVTVDPLQTNSSPSLVENPCLMARSTKSLVPLQQGDSAIAPRKRSMSR